VRVTRRDCGYNGLMTSPDLPLSPPERVLVDQPFTEEGLYSLRAAVAAHASNLGAGPVLVERLLILASELATNAIRHAGGSGRLRLWRDEDAVHLEISDQGPGLPDPTVGTKPPDTMSVGGRGMWICRQLVNDLQIATGPNGTTITAVLGLDGDTR
jgi:anti-sigma regulatory factor (Ser/Thr protein kinase)